LGDESRRCGIATTTSWHRQKEEGARRRIYLQRRALPIPGLQALLDTRGSVLRTSSFDQLPPPERRSFLVCFGQLRPNPRLTRGPAMIQADFWPPRMAGTTSSSGVVRLGSRIRRNGRRAVQQARSPCHAPTLLSRLPAPIRTVLDSCPIVPCLTSAYVLPGKR
jgi:hypothetical protein